MPRRLIAAALVVLVQFSVLCAPLMHVHLDAEETDHHHGQAMHAHLSGHAAAVEVPSGPVVDHQETAGRIARAQIFVAAATAPFSLPVVPASVHVLVVPPARPGGRAPHVAHAHDPPSLTAESPRPPPASLS